jgi:hypothetical protein
MADIDVTRDDLVLRIAQRALRIAVACPLMSISHGEPTLEASAAFFAAAEMLDTTLYCLSFESGDQLVEMMRDQLAQLEEHEGGAWAA